MGATSQRVVRRASSIAAILLAGALALGAAATAQRVDVTVGETKSVSLRSPANKINVASPGVVDLFLADPQTLSVRGLKPGTTFLVVDYEQGSIETVAVVVTPATQVPADVLADQLRQNLKSVEGIQITVQGDKVAISGTTDPRNASYYRQVTAMFADQIVSSVRFAEAARTRSASGPGVVKVALPPVSPPPPPPAQSVQIDVEIVEVDVSRARDLGIAWFPGGQPWVYNGTGAINQNAVITGGATLDKVQLELIALVNRGAARLLATPKLLVQSGKRATLVVGGEVPIVLQTALTSSVEYKKFGTQLDISPVVQSNNKIAVTLKATISELSFENAIGAGGYPTILSREAETDLVIDDGRTFAMAGLLRRTDSRSHDGLPLLGEIPVVGWLFSTESVKSQDLETLIFVTPHLLASGSTGIAPGQAISDLRSRNATLGANEVPGPQPPSPPQGQPSAGGHWWEGN